MTLIGTRFLMMLNKLPKIHGEIIYWMLFTHFLVVGDFFLGVLWEDGRIQSQERLKRINDTLVLVNEW